MAPFTAGQPDAYTDPQVAAQGGVLSRLGVFIGCEGECREALIAGDLEGALRESKLAGWTERAVLLAQTRLRARSSIERRCPPSPSAMLGRCGRFNPQRASTALRITLSPSGL